MRGAPQAMWWTVLGVGAVLSTSAPAHAQNQYTWTGNAGLGLTLSWHANRGSKGRFSTRAHVYGELSWHPERNAILSPAAGVELAMRGVRDEPMRMEAVLRLGGGFIQGPHLPAHITVARGDVLAGVSRTRRSRRLDPMFGLGVRGGPLMVRTTSIASGESDRRQTWVDLGWELGWIPSGVGIYIDGRPIRDAAPVRRPVVVGVGQQPRVRRWARRGQDELAAVVAFQGLARELAALGAPSRLVGRALQAAREEAGHAAIALGRAAELQGRALSVQPLRLRPRPMPSRPEALQRLAQESVQDGVINEGAAARRLWAEASSSRCPRDAALLAHIAEEEEGHVVLAKQVASWCRSDPAWGAAT